MEVTVKRFFPYLNIYRALLLRIEQCETEKSKRRLPIEYTFICDTATTMNRMKMDGLCYVQVRNYELKCMLILLGLIRFDQIS